MTDESTQIIPEELADLIGEDTTKLNVRKHILLNEVLAKDKEGKNAKKENPEREVSP